MPSHERPSYNNRPSLSAHTPEQERRYLVTLLLVVALLASLYPALVRSTYQGSADLHAMLEMIGSLLGLIAGMTLFVQFRALGSRIHLFIGLAFFVNGAEDFMHGLLSFLSTHGFAGEPASSLAQFIPGTYVTGRLMLGFFLVLAPFIGRRFPQSQHPRRESLWIALAAFVLTLLATTLAFWLPLPQFILPENVISRPVDMLSAGVLFLAWMMFLRAYHQDRDRLVWWIMLSIGINIVGQVLMSLSKGLYDPFFDIAHLYKVLGYATPLLGFSFYQIATIVGRKQAEERLETINQFAVSLLEQTTVDDIVWDVARNAIARLGFEDCVVYLLDDTGERLIQRAAYGPKNPKHNEILDPIEILVGSGIVGAAAATAKAQLVRDTREDPRYILDDQRRLSELAVPMVTEGRVLGVIDSEHHQVGFYTEEHVEILKTIAAMASTKIVEATSKERLERIVAELQRAEEALRFQKTLLESQSEAAIDGILVVSDQGEWISVNQRFLELWQIPEQVASQRSSEAALAWVQDHVVDPVTFHAKIQDLYAHPDKTIRDEIVLKDGRIFDRFSAPIKSDEGFYYGRIWNYRDVTLQKQVEQALRASQEELRKSTKKYRQVVEHAQYVVFQTNLEGELSFLNQAWTTLFGYSIEDSLSKSLHRFILPDDHPETTAMFRDVVSARKPECVCQFRLVGLNGVRWVEGTARLDIDDDGQVRGVSGTIHDITDRKQAVEALLEAKTLAEQSALAKEQFLANMSHEIRTPLNAVIGMTHLLQESSLTLTQERYLDAIQFSADTLLLLINDILDFAKIEAGMITFEAVPFRLDELVQSVIDSQRFKAQERGLDLRLERAEGLPNTLIGDPLRLNQILVNLVSNAIKFTEAGHVTVSVIQDATHAEDVVLRVTVSDTGIGIAPDKLEVIFDSFAQARSDTTRQYGGTGLGLSIVKELTERQGGRLFVESEPGKGSTFGVVLTFRLAQDEDLARHPVTSADDLDIAGARLLLVEDNEMNQFVASEMLERWGAHVTVVGHGRAAIETLRTESFDLVLMDIQMPEMDGYEATRIIRGELGLSSAHLPILALTASALIEQRTRAYAAGMNDFILKPFAPQDLRQRIALHLKTHAGKASPSMSIPTDGALSEPLADTPSIDLAFLQEQALGQSAFVLKIIDVFLAQVPQDIDALEQTLVDHDWSQARFIAHKMKSTAGMIGAHPLASILRSIEVSVDEHQELDQLPSLVQQALEQLRGVRDALHAVRETL